MAKYKLLEKAFIDNRLWEIGEEVEVPEGTRPGPHMQPVDSEAKKVAKEIGLVNGPMPDPVDEMTMSDAERLGASPQGVKSGMQAAGQ